MGKKQPRPIEKVLPKSGGPIWQLNKNDVLSGKGSRIQDYKGNIQMRKIVNQIKKRYFAEPKKLGKKFIAAGIVEEIRNMQPPGRFLKRDHKDYPYFEIGDTEAFEKTQQALRDAAPHSETDAIAVVEDGKSNATDGKANAKSEEKEEPQDRLVIGSDSSKKISDRSSSKGIASAAWSHHLGTTHTSSMNGNIAWQCNVSMTVWHDCGKRESDFLGERASPTRQTVCDTVTFFPVDEPRSEASSITATGASADTSRRGETVNARNDDPNRPFPQDKHSEHCRILVQQQQHVSTTTRQKEATLPNDLKCTHEDVVCVQDDKTLDIGDFNLWFKSGHMQETVLVNSKDEMTMGSFDSPIWVKTGCNFNTEQQQEDIIAARYAMTLDSFNAQTGNSLCVQSSTHQPSGSESIGISMSTFAVGMGTMFFESSPGTFSMPES